MTAATLTGPRALTLLGPQRLRPTLPEAVAAAGIDTRVATIVTVTAGWKERETDDRDLVEALTGGINLRVYGRTEEIFARDPALAAAHRQRGQRLEDLQTHYVLRLGYAMDAVVELVERLGPDHPEVTDALDAVRRLDDHLLARSAEVRAEFEDAVRLAEHPLVAAHRHQVADLLAGSVALAIAGGSVPTLLNRLRLLAVADHVGDLHVFAWSAGAMVATERIVLFHDDPPHGKPHARMFEHGLGWVRGVVALPHAHRRLHLGDAARMALFDRRFAPAASLVQSDGSYWVVPR